MSYGPASLTRGQSAFADYYNAVRNDIFRYCYSINFEPTKQQEELLRDVQELTIRGKPTHIACKSGKGTGKSTVTGVIAQWRTLRSHLALTGLTAPTMRQCKRWLAELAFQTNNAPKEIQRFFRFTATTMHVLGMKEWKIEVASSAKPMNMQGWHNPHLSFLIDEASGVPRANINAVLETMTNADKLVLLAGNPNLRDCAFFDCFNRDRAYWVIHTFNSEESPIVNRASIARLLRLYGRNSDIYRVAVLGEFPLQDPNCVMNSEDLEACATHDIAAYVGMSTKRQIGMDFARYGDDLSALIARSGNAVVETAYHSKCEPAQLIAYGFEMQRRRGWTDDQCHYVPDAGGMGQGLMHLFYNRKKKIFEFHSNGAPQQPRVYDDRMTEAFFSLGERVKERLVAIPNDGELISQLSSRQYYLTQDGLIKVESKEDWRDRVQDGSPDKADACVMAFYDGCEGQMEMARIRGSAKHKPTMIRGQKLFGEGER